MGRERQKKTPYDDPLHGSHDSLPHTEYPHSTATTLVNPQADSANALFVTDEVQTSPQSLGSTQQRWSASDHPRDLLHVKKKMVVKPRKAHHSKLMEDCAQVVPSRNKMFTFHNVYSPARQNTVSRTCDLWESNTYSHVDQEFKTSSTSTVFSKTRPIYVLEMQRHR